MIFFLILFVSMGSVNGVGIMRRGKTQNEERVIDFDGASVGDEDMHEGGGEDVGTYAKDVELENEQNWKTCKTTFPSSKRIAILFTGESFRNTGAQLERGICGNGTIQAQKDAAASHVRNLIMPLKALGYEANVFGATYPCTNGWSALPETLSEFYGHHMTKLAVIKRSELEFGGQVYAYQAAMEEAMRSGIAYDYYLVMRWDLVITTPVDFSCALDGKGVARHIGMLNGMDTRTAMGHFNMDWLMIVPGQLSICFSMMLNSDPESCCTHECLGSACTDCADTLNKRFTPGVDPIVEKTGACPSEPIRLQRATAPVVQRATCKCCHERGRSALLSNNHIDDIDLDTCSCPQLAQD